MAKTKNKTSRRTQSIINLTLFVGIIIFINILANARIGGRSLYANLDLTEDKRFTLTKSTRELLRELDDVVYVRVLLDGKFPAGFKRLQTSVREMLDDFRGQTGYIEYEFDDPSQGTVKEINDRRAELAKEGVIPVSLRVEGSDQTSVQLIYPYAQLYYKGRSINVNLLENERGIDQEVAINNSIELLEYKMANAIQKLQTAVKPVIAFTTGHGELLPIETADLEKNLRQFYETGRLHLDSLTYISQDVSLLVIAKPCAPFSEKDKFKLDQYVMNGGKIMWLIDKVNVELDSLRSAPSYFPKEYDLNLDDLLFKYGIRIQPNMVLDLQCSRIPQIVGMMGNEPQIELMKYPYHPIVTTNSKHPIVNNLEATNFFYPSTIDTTIRTKLPVQKTSLLASSNSSFMQYLPIEMNFDFLRYGLDPQRYNKPPQTLAMLVEGTFASLYENRLPQDFLDSLKLYQREFKQESVPTSMLVVSDGDIAKSKVDFAKGSFMPLAFNEFERFTFANKDFLINSIEYLMGEQGFIAARNKEVKLRLLDPARIQTEKTKWQLINIITPIIFLIFFGFIYNWLRKRRYAA